MGVLPWKWKLTVTTLTNKCCQNVRNNLFVSSWGHSDNGGMYLLFRVPVYFTQMGYVDKHQCVLVAWIPNVTRDSIVQGFLEGILTY